jgi:hypothetical protein
MYTLELLETKIELKNLEIKILKQKLEETYLLAIQNVLESGHCREATKLTLTETIKLKDQAIDFKLSLENAKNYLKRGDLATTLNILEKLYK